jgi:alpha/beta superfamily hydrolase
MSTLHHSLQLEYIAIPATNRKLFTQIHFPKETSKKAFFIFSPILDEAKRAHTFQAITARQLSSLGFLVIRFDYFGTGDSFGELFEFDFEESLADAQYLIDLLSRRHFLTEIKLLGLRVGADLAIKIASQRNSPDELHLIEPVINGARYLFEQRLRRKTFMKINRMTDLEQVIKIGSHEYEDYQGFPLSKAVLSFLQDLDSEKTMPAGKKIFLYETSAMNSGKRMARLLKIFSDANQASLKKVACGDFWASLNAIDTAALTDEILQNLKISQLI